jgi:hypothetical protein
MRLLRGLFFAASVMAVVPMASHADTRTLASAGAWTVFGGTTTSDRPVCGISSSGKGRYFGLKFYKGDDTLTIQLGSSSWKIDDKVKQRVTMRIDDNGRWNANATGMHFNDGDAGLEFEINRRELSTFIREFRNGDAIILTFPDSDAEDWRGSLSGTDQVISAFNRCVDDLD